MLRRWTGAYLSTQLFDLRLLQDLGRLLPVRGSATTDCLAQKAAPYGLITVQGVAGPHRVADINDGL